MSGLFKCSVCKKDEYIFEEYVDFCPFCGFSYQPERLNPETPSGDAIV